MPFRTTTITGLLTVALAIFLLVVQRRAAAVQGQPVRRAFIVIVVIAMVLGLASAVLALFA